MRCCTSGRRFLLMPEGQMSLPGSSNRTRSFLLPSSLATARASPSCLTTSVLPCRHLTTTATRYGSKSLTSSAGRGRATINSPSFRLSIQGQYEDVETGLYYNRFRYYEPNTGTYISQDPIGLAGNNPTLYGYVNDINTHLDVLGLTIIPTVTRGANKEVLTAEATIKDQI